MIKPTTRLFLGCDLVGSTAFKQSDESWPIHFLSFYRQFPQLLYQVEGANGASRFKLWKAIGDELIFSVEVHSEKEVLWALETWIQAMDTYEADTLSKVNLRSKGGAFLATFPEPNSESTIPIDPSIEDSDADVVQLNARALSRRTPTKYLYDYFGPSFDTGFRVFGSSNQRYFTLTLETAHAALEAIRMRDRDAVSPAISYRGAHEFKGVWEGREYPLFAIDRHKDDAVNKAMSELNGGELDPAKAEQLCRACVSHPAWRTRVYLRDSPHDCFGTLPGDTLAKLAEKLVTGKGAEERADEKLGSECVPQQLP